MTKYRGRKPGQLLDEFYPWAQSKQFTSKQVGTAFGISHGRAVAFLRRLRGYGNIRVLNKREFAGAFLYELTDSGNRTAEYRSKR